MEIEAAGRAEADVAVQGQLAAAHPRTPVEQAVGDDHAVLAGRAHGCDVLCRAAGPINPHRPAVGAVKDAVHRARRPGAGPAGGQLGQVSPVA